MNQEQLRKHTIQCFRRATYHTCVLIWFVRGRAIANALLSHPSQGSSEIFGKSCT